MSISSALPSEPLTPRRAQLSTKQLRESPLPTIKIADLKKLGKGEKSIGCGPIPETVADEVTKYVVILVSTVPIPYTRMEI